MKIVFMGTPDFAIPPLQRLIDSPHQVVLVVTQPDRPKGRGRQLASSPVKDLAEANGIPVITPKSVRKENTAAEIRALNADVAVVAAYGQILPDEALAATRLGCLNIHPSLLPEYRGAAPIQRCLLDGKIETGVTIMQLVRELDAGPIISQQRVDILPDDDALSLSQMLSVLGADMLLRAIDEAEKSGKIESVEQDHALATFAPPIKKEEGLIPWSDPAERIMYRLRALTPWPGATTYINGERALIVVQAETRVEEETQPDPKKRPAPGTVVGIDKGFGFLVQCGDGPLLVTKVKPEGKSEMDAYAFVVGRGIQQGDVFKAPGKQAAPESEDATE